MDKLCSNWQCYCHTAPSWAHFKKCKCLSDKKSWICKVLLKIKPTHQRTEENCVWEEKQYSCSDGMLPSRETKQRRWCPWLGSRICPCARVCPCPAGHRLRAKGGGSQCETCIHTQVSETGGLLDVVRVQHANPQMEILVSRSCKSYFSPS